MLNIPLHYMKKRETCTLHAWEFREIPDIPLLAKPASKSLSLCVGDFSRLEGRNSISGAYVGSSSAYVGSLLHIVHDHQ